MTRADDTLIRVLAIDPTSKGFGFAVLEGTDRLVDWGTRTCQGDKEAACMKAVMELCDWYGPDVLMLEDCTARGSRRRARVRALLRRIAALAMKANVRVRFIPWSRVYPALIPEKAPTKDENARAVAARFPELARQLPPVRRPWMSEDERMAIFDATALALAALAPRSTTEAPRA